LSVVPLLPYFFDEPVEHVVESSFRALCRTIGGEKAVTPSQPPSKAPADKATPLSSLLKLQSQKKRLEEGSDGKAPSWDEYKEEKQREREQRKQEHEGSTRGWFGFGKKGKEE
jgi:fission process protein 1